MKNTVKIDIGNQNYKQKGEIENWNNKSKLKINNQNLELKLETWNWISKIEI